MKSGKAFELFVKKILLNIGYAEVKSDGLYIFDGSPGQMIQGLGEAHNADVLLEPPVQIPFLSNTRILIECKDYKKRVGLDIVRSALGLREDVNHFDVIDINKLAERKKQRRSSIVHNYERFSYQVVVASLNGFTTQAQEFAATHRIPLLGFDKMPFWSNLRYILEYAENAQGLDDDKVKERLIQLADTVARRMAVAITNSGQLLFLYSAWDGRINFGNEFFLHWRANTSYWELVSDENRYIFQLPEHIAGQWLNNVANDFELRKQAINCKEEFFSNMVVYYNKNGQPKIKMISIDQYSLNEAKRSLEHAGNV